VSQPSTASGPELRPEEYRRLAALLHGWTGIRLYAKEHLMSGRLAPLMRELGLARYSEYYEQLETAGKDSQEAQRFINALTTNKTSFFRESHHFQFVVDHVIPEVRARAQQGGPRRLRLYSAACSRGAEPYSMAVLCAQHLPAAQGWDVRILATDLDTDVLAEAKRGVYDETELGDVPPELRKRWFLRDTPGHVRVNPEAQQLVTFAQANLIASPFPVRGQFDAIFCRNVMIYFDRPTQDKLVAELLKLLVPGGVIAIGHSETLMLPELTREHTIGVYRLRGAPANEHARPAAKPLSLTPRTPVRKAEKERPRRRIVLGQWCATKEPHAISTLLGSCVAACIFDPVARIGGMNHFMLPRVTSSEDDCARFGVHAMEVLINELMRLGADRARLQAKAFGGAAVTSVLTSTVAAQNEAFVRQFLKREGIPLVGARLGGKLPREVILFSDTGEVRVRVVEGAQHIDRVRAEETTAYQSLLPPAVFDPESVLF
jgi:chemotaxis protein methyltransferase CheR